MDLERARRFCDAYAASLAAAETMVAHWAEPFTSYTSGTATTFANRAAAVAGTKPYLARLAARGLADIRLASAEIVPVSTTFGLAHLTWSVHPQDGSPGWHWLNVYGLRLDARGPRFELVVADNEIAGLMTRHPDLLR